MVFDGVPHVSAASIPLASRCFVVSSFGKTYHVTGWKVGYVAAPRALTEEFRKVHQFNVFTVNTPVQHGLARYMADPAPYLELPAFYQRKRDLFRAGLAGSKLRLLPSQGSYFQCVDYSRVSAAGNRVLWWLTRGGCLPFLSAFYADGAEQQIARLCFAKRDDTLNRALARLARLSEVGVSGGRDARARRQAQACRCGCAVHLPDRSGPDRSAPWDGLHSSRQQPRGSAPVGRRSTAPVWPPGRGPFARAAAHPRRRQGVIGLPGQI
jgi:hypothetical protein